MASKCVSQPDEAKVKSAIKTAFNITLPEVFIFSLKIFHRKIQNVTKNDTFSKALLPNKIISLSS